MEKRVFLAIFLSFAILAIFQTWVAPPPPPPKPGPTPTATGSDPAANITPTPAPPVIAPSPAAPPVTPDATARDIVVETKHVFAVFTTQGAALKSWQLRKYLGADQKPLELIPVDLPASTFPRPFTLSTDDDKVTGALAAAIYEPSTDRLTLDEEPGSLTFQYRGDDGLLVRKAYHFQPDRQAFVLKTEFSVERAGTPLPMTIHFGPAVGPGHAASSTQWPNQALVFMDGEVTRVGAADIPAQPRYEGAIRYAGVEDHYFLAAALPSAERLRAEFAAVQLPVPGAEANVTRSLIQFSVRQNPATPPSQLAAFRYFMGPKDFDQLRMADPQLTLAIDFGWFSWIVVPLLQALKWINRFIGNYGWSIIILTILINVLIFPLRHKSMVSMKKMQALQPQIKAIQDRYAKYKLSDPERQKMNPEMMALYKQKGVNPASGCIPMLLTFPILLAFYNLLNSAIELRGAPFVGWIHDLSAKDPYYFWPILMGASMFWQQKMTPSTADPMQQKIFLLMPLIFTVMFLNMPSGLVIYWLVSNVLTVAQQYLTNHLTRTPMPRKA